MNSELLYYYKNFILLYYNNMALALSGIPNQAELSQTVAPTIYTALDQPSDVSAQEKLEASKYGKMYYNYLRAYLSGKGTSKDPLNPDSLTELRETLISTSIMVDDSTTMTLGPHVDNIMWLLNNMPSALYDPVNRRMNKAIEELQDELPSTLESIIDSITPVLKGSAIVGSAIKGAPIIVETAKKVKMFMAEAVQLATTVSARSQLLGATPTQFALQQTGKAEMPKKLLRGTLGMLSANYGLLVGSLQQSLTYLLTEKETTSGSIDFAVSSQAYKPAVPGSNVYLLENPYDQAFQYPQPFTGGQTVYDFNNFMNYPVQGLPQPVGNTTKTNAEIQGYVSATFPGATFRTVSLDGFGNVMDLKTTSKGLLKIESTLHKNLKPQLLTQDEVIFVSYKGNPDAHVLLEVIGETTEKRRFKVLKTNDEMDALPSSAIASPNPVPTGTGSTAPIKPPKPPPLPLIPVFTPQEIEQLRQNRKIINGLADAETKNIRDAQDALKTEKDDSVRLTLNKAIIQSKNKLDGYNEILRDFDNQLVMATKGKVKSGYSALKINTAKILDKMDARLKILEHKTKQEIAQLEIRVRTQKLLRQPQELFFKEMTDYFDVIKKLPKKDRKGPIDKMLKKLEDALMKVKSKALKETVTMSDIDEFEKNINFFIKDVLNADQSMDSEDYEELLMSNFLKLGQQVRSGVDTKRTTKEIIKNLNSLALLNNLSGDGHSFKHSSMMLRATQPHTGTHKIINNGISMSFAYGV